jgi:D-amino-acid oxidase
MQITVIGCGVMGLSCGIRLLEAGHTVRIMARELPPHTTSNIAAAVWYPYKAYPQELVNHWGRVAYAVFEELARLPGAGVAMAPGLEIFERSAGDPGWRSGLPGYRRAEADELPPGYVDGFVFTVPIVETPVYMRYLLERFESAGGVVRQVTLARIDEAFEGAGAVVNCSGLGARELVGDASLYPIRGQVVRVAPAPIGHFLIDDYGQRGLAYIVPRSDGIILGGTAEEGAEELAPDPATAAAIIARCAALEPALRELAVLEHKVGLRPGRASVRLEAERWANDKLLVHNYGHGGAGVTLSWGCAAEVARLVAQ